MPEEAAAIKTQVEIPHALFEYTAKFEDPVLRTWKKCNEMIASVLVALKPWGFALDGVEAKWQSQKLHEHTVVFRRTNPPDLPNQARSFSVGLGAISVSAANIDWTEAGDFISAMSKAMSAVSESLEPKISSQHVVLSMHVQMKGRAVKDATVSLLSEDAMRLVDGELKGAAVVLTRDKSSVVVDTSLAYANALFVRISREHSGAVTLTAIAEALRKDEENLFEVLDLEGEL